MTLPSRAVGKVMIMINMAEREREKAREKGRDGEKEGEKERESNGCVCFFRLFSFSKEL